MQNVINLRVGDRLHTAELHQEVLFQPTPYRICNRVKGLRGWLSRTAWSILVRYGTIEPYMHKHTSWTYTKRTEADLLTAIIEHANHMGYRAEDLRRYTIVIGAYTFQHILRQPAMRDTLGLSVSLNHYHNGYHTVIGLPVYVVPYMEGMAFIPKNIIEERRSA